MTGHLPVSADHEGQEPLSAFHNLFPYFIARLLTARCASRGQSQAMIQSCCWKYNQLLLPELHVVFRTLFIVLSSASYGVINLPEGQKRSSAAW